MSDKELPALPEPNLTVDICDLDGTQTSVYSVDLVRHIVAQRDEQIAALFRDLEIRDALLDQRRAEIKALRAERVPLTDEQIVCAANEAFETTVDEDDETLVNKYGHGVYISRYVDFARAIERAHGIDAARASATPAADPRPLAGVFAEAKEAARAELRFFDQMQAERDAARAKDRTPPGTSGGSD